MPAYSSLLFICHIPRGDVSVKRRRLDDVLLVLAAEAPQGLQVSTIGLLRSAGISTHRPASRKMKSCASTCNDWKHWSIFN